LGAFGERLRRERELRGISLDQIVATTKIGRRLLLALEEEQFDLLPGGIFNKSYVRAYAKCVGIDEDEAVAEYLEAAKETPPDTRVIAHQHASIHSERASQRPGFPVLPVLILLVVIAGGIGGWKLYQDRVRSRQSSSEMSNVPAPAGPAAGASGAASTDRGPAATAPSPVQQAQPKASTVSASSTVPAGAPAGSFEVTVLPKDRAWVSIKVDGNYVVRGIIQPPESRTIHASDEVVVYTSNAAAVEVSFNGKNVPLTAGRGEEESLVFGPHGLKPKADAQ